jgi:prophage tail gpP-like protein
MANEAFGSYYIEIGGARYDRVTNLSVKRAKEEATSSGTITLSWPGAEQFNAQSPPAQEFTDGAKGTIYLDGQKVCTFRVDTRNSSGTPETYKLDLQFRGLAGAVVDGHPDHPTGQENKKAPPDICKKLMEGYEPQLIDKSGYKRQLERYIIDEGETVERAMRRCTREFGLIFHENEDGNLELKKKGDDEGSGHSLVLGRNFFEWGVKRDISPRHKKVKTKGNAIPTDKKYGKEAEELAGDAIDEYVKYQRMTRVLIDSDHDKETLKKRAVTEARRRKAQGLNVTLKMSTWSDDGGQLWKVGKLHHVTIPVDQVDEVLQISSVTFDLDKDTRTASLVLVAKESYDDSGGGGGKDKGGSAGGKSSSSFMSDQIS